MTTLGWPFTVWGWRGWISGRRGTGPGTPWWHRRRHLRRGRSRGRCSPAPRSCSQPGRPPLPASTPDPTGWTGKAPRPGPGRRRNARPMYPLVEEVEKHKVLDVRLQAWISKKLSFAVFMFSSHLLALFHHINFSGTHNFFSIFFRNSSFNWGN